MNLGELYASVAGLLAAGTSPETIVCTGEDAPSELTIIAKCQGTHSVSMAPKMIISLTDGPFIHLQGVLDNCEWVDKLASYEEVD